MKIHVFRTNTSYDRQMDERIEKFVNFDRKSEFGRKLSCYFEIE